MHPVFACRAEAVNHFPLLLSPSNLSTIFGYLQEENENNLKIPLANAPMCRYNTHMVKAENPIAHTRQWRKTPVI